jgi:hypothetical protein
VELFSESCCLVGGLDDDPLVAGPAERLPLDELAGQPVAGQARQGLPGREPAADLEFHQLAGAHSGDRGDHGRCRGADDPD